MNLKIKIGQIREPTNSDHKTCAIKLFDEQWRENVDAEPPEQELIQRVFAVSTLYFHEKLTAEEVKTMLPGMIEDFKKLVCKSVINAEFVK